MKLFSMTIGSFLRRAADNWPDVDALVEASTAQKMTWRELDAVTDTCARGLWAKGIRPGDNVLAWSDNSVALVVCALSVMKIGAAFVPLNIHLTEHELKKPVTRCKASAIIYSDGHRGMDFAQVVRGLLGKKDGVQSSTLKLAVSLGSKKFPGAVDMDDLLKAGAENADAACDSAMSAANPDDTAAILFTSGSTCEPKGVLLSHTSLINNAYFSLQRLGLDAVVDRCCMAVPLFHCFGLSTCLLGCMAFGAPLVILGRCKIEEIVTHCRKYNCTVLHGVPTIFSRLVDVVKSNPSCELPLKKGVIAGSFCHEKLMDDIVNILEIKGICTAYGQTECSPCCTQTFPHDSVTVKKHSVGPMLPEIEMKVIDCSSGALKTTGEIGEICSRGYHIAKGYLGKNWSVNTITDEEGWFHSGDAGFVDEQGNWHFAYRMKDIIIRGGENISLCEVESVMSEYPLIKQVKTFAVSVPDLDEEVAAALVVEKGCSLNAEDLKTFLRTKLSYYKIPRHMVLLEEMPLTESGKIDVQFLKKYLRKQLRTVNQGVELFIK